MAQRGGLLEAAPGRAAERGVCFPGGSAPGARCAGEGGGDLLVQPSAGRRGVDRRAGGGAGAVRVREPLGPRLDLSFRLGGSAVRVSPLFWAAAAVLGVR